MYGSPVSAIKGNFQQMGQKEGPANRFVTGDNLMIPVNNIVTMSASKGSLCAGHLNVPPVVFSHPQGPSVKVMKGSASTAGRGGLVPRPWGGLLGRGE